MGGTQVDQTRAKAFCAGEVAVVLGGELLFEVGEIVGVAGVFLLDAFAEGDDLAG